MNGTGTTIGQPLLEFLTAEQADEIHSATLEVLERSGVNVHNARARALLRDAGARVEGDLRVRIPPALVGRALGSAPERVVMADRLGRRAMALERANHEKWMAEGETTLRDRARAKVERLLALPAPPPPGRGDREGARPDPRGALSRGRLTSCASRAPGTGSRG